ncbi:unnamed protein product [Oppiella nova]|uniref:Uncharacterized protein n=1 Tax=Oppiella nova TaxID=334625 RepID=A0A7R9QI62_9ACAR|nr:unnamed protein product [Oppiella nova]CAG2166250.1 unnamed protein product [Oppiella nova]
MLLAIKKVAKLIHPGMMYVFVASTRNIFAFSHYFVIQLFFSHLTTTFIVSYIFSLVIEYPFLSLERVLQNGLMSGTHSRKTKLYSVTSVDSTASDVPINGDDQMDATEKYNTLRPFAPLPQEFSFTYATKVDTICKPNNFVINYKL